MNLELGQFKEMVHFVQHQGKDLDKDVEKYHKRVYDLVSTELDKFKESFYSLGDILQEVELALVVRKGKGNWDKRSVLPGVGSLLSVLFGTATQGNLNKLKGVVENLGSNQHQLVHVVENSISVLNITHKAAAENRQSINLLRNATVEFHSTLSALIRKMSKLQAEVSYLEVITSIHGFTHVITLAMQKAKWELEKLMQIITDAAEGQISMVWMKPSNLLALLKDIQKHLPDDMSFPFLLNPSGIWRYYCNLQPFMIPDNQKLHVVLALPVVHHNSRYDLIQAISLPVPAFNVSLSASHKLESEYFIISPQKEWYALMKQEDVAYCDRYLGCKYTGPLYKVKNFPRLYNCIVL